jgi:hypothetical protein
MEKKNHCLSSYAFAYFLLGLTLTGCVTKKETYLIILDSDQAQIKPVCDKETIYINHFERQFHKADITFMAKFREASNQAAKEASK